MNLKELREAAKEAGIKNYTRKKEDTLRKELGNIVKENKATIVKDFNDVNFSYDENDDINSFERIYLESFKPPKYSLNDDLTKMSSKEQFDRARYFRELNAPKASEPEIVIPYRQTEEYRVAIAKKGKK